MILASRASAFPLVPARSNQIASSPDDVQCLRCLNSCCSMTRRHACWAEFHSVPCPSTPFGNALNDKNRINALGFAGPFAVPAFLIPLLSAILFENAGGKQEPGTYHLTLNNYGETLDLWHKRTNQHRWVSSRCVSVVSCSVQLRPAQTRMPRAKT